jgi:hypothetical protein
MEVPSFVWQAILAALDEVGNLAVTPEKPYGLRCYPYLHREQFPGVLRGTATEERTTDGLARALRQRGLTAFTERFYPDSRERCDLVIEVASRQELWIECKTAYCENLNGFEGDKPTKYYGKNSWKAGVADIAAKDIHKLNRLRAPQVCHVGILLIGFDRLLQPITNEELYALLPHELESWVQGERT